MPPPPQNFKDDLIQRTISNLEQAKGIRRISVPVAQVLGQQQNRNVQFPPNTLSLSDATSESGESSHPDNMATNLAASTVHNDRIPDRQPPLSPRWEPAPTPATTSPTRAQLTSSLNASTALVQNLRLRNSIQAADLQRANASIETRRASVIAKLQVEGKKKLRWMTTSCASLGLWVVYMGWCWVNSVEFEYVRRRRMDVLGML